MGRQSGDDGRLSVWAAREMRPEPYIFPVHLSFEMPCADDGLRRNVTLEKDTVVVETRDGRTRRIDVSDYRGLSVAIAQATDGTGRIAAMVILEHEDDDLTMPLHVAHDSTDVVEAWRSWARALDLPLLVKGVEGDCRGPAPAIGALVAAQAAPRRAAAYLASRRPGFLQSRAPGHKGPVKRYAGVEMIARR